MGIGCGGYCAKYLLCLFNFMLFMAGAAVLAVGVWLQLDKKSLTDLVNSNIPIPEFETIVQPRVISYVLIATGAFIFFVSFMGYCGAVQESKCLLASYGVMLVLILVMELTAAGMAFANKSKGETETRKFLLDTLNEYTHHPNKSDSVTNMWNLIMAEMSCCGVDNYKDFSAISTTQIIPRACCVLKGDKKNLTPQFPECTTEPSAVNSYYMTGCYNTVRNKVLDHINVVIWVLLGVIFTELLTVFLSFCLCKSLQIYDDRY